MLCFLAFRASRAIKRKQRSASLPDSLWSDQSFQVLYLLAAASVL